MNTSLSKLQEIMKDREDCCAAVHGAAKSWTWLSNWTITTDLFCLIFKISNLKCSKLVNRTGRAIKLMMNNRLFSLWVRWSAHSHDLSYQLTNDCLKWALQGDAAAGRGECIFSPMHSTQCNWLHGVSESLLALACLDFQLNFVFFLFLEICSYLIFSPLSLYGGGGLVTKSCLTFAISLTLACQAPLSMGFSRQEYWSGLPCPSPGDLPNPGIEPGSPAL